MEEDDADDLAAFQELEADLAALAEEDNSDDDETFGGSASKRRLRDLASGSLDGWVGGLVWWVGGLGVDGYSFVD